MLSIRTWLYTRRGFSPAAIFMCRQRGGSPLRRFSPFGLGTFQGSSTTRLSMVRSATGRVLMTLEERDCQRKSRRKCGGEARKQSVKEGGGGKRTESLTTNGTGRTRKDESCGNSTSRDSTVRKVVSVDAIQRAQVREL